MPVRRVFNFPLRLLKNYQHGLGQVLALLAAIVLSPLENLPSLALQCEAGYF
jgi:hypothetical protein